MQLFLLVVIRSNLLKKIRFQKSRFQIQDFKKQISYNTSKRVFFGICFFVFWNLYLL